MTDSSTFAPGAHPLRSLLGRELSRNWWVLLLRGVAAIIFGVLAFIWPGHSLLALTLLWGAYAVADGVLSLSGAFRGETRWGSRWWLGLVGVAGIIAGVGTFFYPGMTALVLLTFIAVWAIVIGVLEVAGAIRLRKEIRNEWLLILNGLIAIAFGVYLLVRPGQGALTLIWVIGAYAIISGLVSVAFAFRVKGFGQS